MYPNAASGSACSASCCWQAATSCDESCCRATAPPHRNRRRSLRSLEPVGSSDVECAEPRAGAGRSRRLVPARPVFRPSLARLGVGVAAAVLGCSSPGEPPHPNLTAAWRSFLALPAERAMAIAGDPRRDRWVTAASAGHPSKGQAEEGALSECRKRREARRIQASCVLYAAGSEVVWQDR